MSASGDSPVGRGRQQPSLICSRFHTSKLDQAKRFEVSSDSGLQIKDRSSVIALDRKCNESKERRKGQQPGRRSNDVKHPPAPRHSTFRNLLPKTPRCCCPAVPFP